MQMSLIHPVPAFEQDMLSSLMSVAALAGVGVGLVDGVEIGAEADFALLLLLAF
jgi:hypothetical protein